MYGDHLYKKGDFEGAMQQYQNTIGHLDPSYVIRRFLDAQRIGLLTSYLEGLHEAGQASSDHTTLLLNCHTKLKVRYYALKETGIEAPSVIIVMQSQCFVKTIVWAPVCQSMGH